MPDVSLPPPFEAYAGAEPYLFASYAHLDGAVVFPELVYLHEQGYRVWYDEGIDPGNEWPDEVAKALAKAAFFIVFISPNAVASQNVRNEINYALNNKKPFLAIHIVNTDLPPGLQLRMGDIQAIMKYQMAPDNYTHKLRKVLPSSVGIPSPILEELISRIHAAQGSDAFLVGNVLVCFSPTGDYGSATFDDVGSTVSKEFQRKLPEEWRLHGEVGAGRRGGSIRRRWRNAGGHARPDAIALEILAVHQLIYPNISLSALTIQNAGNPCTGGRWLDITGGDYTGVEFTCKLCGSIGEFTPALEGPPSACRQCGAQ